MARTPFIPATSALVATLIVAGAAHAQGKAPTFEPRRAEVAAAASGRPLAVAGANAPERTVVDVLRARGRPDATLATVHLVDTRGGRAGARHLRFEQTVDGLQVYGAYARAAFDRSGALVHLIDQLAPVPAAALPPARIGAQAALRVVLDQLHPGAPADLGVVRNQGAVSTFVGGAFFHEQPTVTAVAVPLSDGSMTRGWLVETWTQRTNLLHHTLVSGDGQILHVEKRTANDSYNVFADSPGTGPQTVTSGPPVGNPLSPSGWLGTGPQTTVNIIGNNVNAYLDTDANNRADAGGTAVTNGNFVTAANLAAMPSTTGNKAVAVQNLFYLNNVIHDILYGHGFTEAAGNFQNNNFGNGGAARDAVNAEAQDGSGTDNANFSTPPDGRKPRMQMYLWTGAGPTHEVVITSPSSATYAAKGADFGQQLTTTGLAGSIRAGSPADGCTTMTSVSGKIALVDRGTCDFSQKALNAQKAGATGVIVANNQGGTALMSMGAGTGARRVTIPAVLISQTDGAALRALASPTGTMRLKAVQPLQIDGDLDSGVVFHEYGHGLTWRMIGGMSGSLAGALGEGASDGVAMLVTGNDKIGQYAGSAPNGIRRFPYAGYPLNYSAVNGAEVHADGEIYAAVIWKLIESFGPGRRSALFDIYVDAMNFIPSTPTYEDMRDGMLQAVAGTADTCTVWTAFAQFGIGAGSSATVNADGSVTTHTSFSKGDNCP